MATRSPKSTTDKAASKPKPAVASVAAVIAPKSKAAVKATAKPSDKPALKAVTAPKFESKPKAKIEALKRRTLLEAVAMHVGVKRTDAREVMDAVLVEMAEALDQGRDLILPPFGKVMLRKDKDGQDGRPMVARIKLIEADKRGASAEETDQD
ncbi:HU family DNA-binding protein [Roseobacter sp. HKCC-CH-9208]|uniref:HU family DNA-binding protein n=1 Tax=Roseobacter sp. HKCC-CH-9208 TaxID=3120339 RepID=UPI0030EDC27D